MSFRSIAQDIKDSFRSLSRRSFDVRFPGHSRGSSNCSFHDLNEQTLVIQTSPWANLLPELLYDVIRRLEQDESTWPTRKHVVACAAVCRTWRQMCMEIAKAPELSGKLTFPISLKQPAPRDGNIQCFIKRDKSNLTYHLFLCLSSALTAENGKFLLAAKRTRRTTSIEYVISMSADNISRSSSTYVGRLRANKSSISFEKVSPKLPSRNYRVAKITYDLNVLGTKGPRKMHCTMHSIPASSIESGGTVPHRQPELHPRRLEDSFRSISFSKSLDQYSEFGSSRFSEFGQANEDDDGKARPLVLKNKAPRWHQQLHCWCLNFRGRVTVASVKNFQLIADIQPANNTTNSTQAAPPHPEHDKIILQFGKIGKDAFTMDYRYPLSAFEAFSICLSSFDTKFGCE